MKIAVLGAAGQLGRDLCPRLAVLGEVVPLTRADIDLRITAPRVIASAVLAIRPDVFVNCSAYNLVDRAEADSITAFEVNAQGISSLSHGCADAGAKFVHFSTDYVFGGDATRTTPYTEDDKPDPLSMYGSSKAGGEMYARVPSPDCLVVRTSGLYGVWGSGGKGGNFVETMLRLAAKGTPLRVVNDQRCTPSYTADVAAATVELIARGATGLYHVVNSGDCTWYEFAAEIFRQEGGQGEPKVPPLRTGLNRALTPITSAEFGAVAKRPAYSVLSTAKLAALGVPPLRSWQDALTAYLVERSNRPTSS